MLDQLKSLAAEMRSCNPEAPASLLAPQWAAFIDKLATNHDQGMKRATRALCNRERAGMNVGPCNYPACCGSESPEKARSVLDAYFDGDEP